MRPIVTRLPDRDQIDAALAAGCDLSPSQRHLLYRYAELLAQWNQAYNLISSHTMSELVPRHLLESLRLLDWIAPTARRLLDIGTGAGLPGLVLAVACPERQFVLLDRGPKKTRFVRQAVLELGLPNVEVETSEVERFEAPVFDCIVARGVNKIAELLRASDRLLGKSGMYVLPKGAQAETEIEALPAGWASRLTVIDPSEPVCTVVQVWREP